MRDSLLVIVRVGHGIKLSELATLITHSLGVLVLFIGFYSYWMYPDRVC